MNKCGCIRRYYRAGFPGFLAEWRTVRGIVNGRADETWTGMTEKLNYRKFYELILDFYHWLHRCIEGYMECS